MNLDSNGEGEHEEVQEEEEDLETVLLNHSKLLLCCAGPDLKHARTVDVRDNLIQNAFLRF